MLEGKTLCAIFAEIEEWMSREQFYDALVALELVNNIRVEAEKFSQEKYALPSNVVEFVKELGRSGRSASLSNSGRGNGEGR